MPVPFVEDLIAQISVAAKRIQDIPGIFQDHFELLLTDLLSFETQSSDKEDHVAEWPRFRTCGWQIKKSSPRVRKVPIPRVEVLLHVKSICPDIGVLWKLK
ncbi:hypothetical protein TNCV_2127411 [Trichonephila clavipes]|nr:hypothetical protein TNCV_2127411 [Trichonephila clavipes]